MKNKYILVFIIFSLFVSEIGTICKVLHFPGANLLLIIGYGLSMIGAVAGIIKPNSEACGLPRCAIELEGHTLNPNCNASFTRVVAPELVADQRAGRIAPAQLTSGAWSLAEDLGRSLRRR